MPKEIYLVKVGMTMTEGTVDEWYVRDGDLVEEGAQLYRLETEKVNMDVDAESSGTVKHIVPSGTTMHPGDVIGWIYAQEESIPDELPSGQPNPNIEVDNTDFDQENASSAMPAESDNRAHSATQASRQDSGSNSRRVASSPAARRLAKERGIDLASLTGTGPRGRITLEDVESVDTADAQPSDDGLVPMTGLRKVIARRMTDSLRGSAQLTMNMQVAMDNCIALRSRLNEEWAADDVRVAFTDLIIVATANALIVHPSLNAFLHDDHLQMHEQVNMGIAVALPEGLIVPVIQDVNSKDLIEISRESADLADRARDGKLTLGDVEGGTFTISSLGMYGVDSFTPIINPPQSGILGVGGIRDGVRWEAERPVKEKQMNLSLTWDHRVLDGAPAAEFLATLKDSLENPDDSTFSF
ncbi:MAG: dihydrolipoamide acetyltransferase family protein [Gammaproteobacteria bacterium]|nr:dihydrolipoamide acetyltransferase family protein [Gammaproteobacteria bacterium]